MIPRELIEMNAYLPVKLSELSKDEPQTALDILQAWGRRHKDVKSALERSERRTGSTQYVRETSLETVFHPLRFPDFFMESKKRKKLQGGVKLAP